MARPLWKFFAASILSNSARGSGCAGVDVARHVPQHVPLPAEVLHELARQLDRVPFDAVDAGHAEILDARQQVVQAVAELVEQRQHLVVREERRLAARPGREKLQVRYATGVCSSAPLRRRVIASSIQAPPRLVSRA